MGRGEAKDLVPAQEPSWSRELVKDIAMDIGKDVCGYIEWMYPEAVKASSSSFLLSVRNSIHNQIIAALDGPIDEASIRARLAARKTWRRKFKALWKKSREITRPWRKPPPPSIDKERKNISGNGVACGSREVQCRCVDLERKAAKCARYGKPSCWS